VRVQVRRKTGGRPPIRDFGTWRGATALLPVLGEIGVESEPLLREAGLSGQAFSHPDNAVPSAGLCRALRLPVDRAGLTDDGTALLGYEVPDPGIAGAEQMSFGALAIAANILRALCGQGFELQAVTFACRSPAESALFRRFFNAPVRFDAERVMPGSSGITIVEVAARLGYANSSTFARAFRRWSGTSPALWRRRNAGA
jgi:AraC-like DNA-binding protein